MKLLLIHGRTHPQERLADWGPNGPEIENIEAIHVTYFTTYAVWFTSPEATTRAQELTGWPVWDTNALEIPRENDLVRVQPMVGRPMWYGDWEVQA